MAFDVENVLLLLTKLKQGSRTYSSSPTRNSQPGFSPFDFPSHSPTEIFLNKSESYCCYVPPSDLCGRSICISEQVSDMPFSENCPSGLSEGNFGEGCINGKVISLHQPSSSDAILYQMDNQPQPTAEAYPTEVLGIQSSTPGFSCSGKKNLSTSTEVIETPYGENPPPYNIQHQQFIYGDVSEDKTSATTMDQVLHFQSIHQPPSTHFGKNSISLVEGSPRQVYAFPSHNDAPNSSLPPPSPPTPRPVAACQRPHPPNAFCRTCLTVRRSHRQNAAAFVRRANSNVCPHNRRSAPSPAISSDSLDDAPSILQRLKREWEIGMVGRNSSSNSNMDIHEAVKRKEGKTISQSVIESSTSVIKKRNGDPPNYVTDDSSTSREVGYEPSRKKNASDLDKVLNRLSIKRNINTYQQAMQSKPPIKPANIIDRYFRASSTPMDLESNFRNEFSEHLTSHPHDQSPNRDIHQNNKREKEQNDLIILE